VVKRHRFAGGDSTHGAKGGIAAPARSASACSGYGHARHAHARSHGQDTRTTQNLEVIQSASRQPDFDQGRDSGRGGDYVVIRESKKRPKGWKPPVQPVSKKKAAAAAKPAAAKK